ncbi:MAG TPA: site-2 protease family protein [Gemmataceae bacterium]|nr:site-2 protease family protein [Gemmataceae bacterium]
MLLLEPEPTRFDLRWRMFGIDVRVHPMFWLVAAILGFEWQRVLGFPYLVLWVICVFISILIHELGHILMGRLFGSNGHIVLYSFGGLAIPYQYLSNRWKRIAVSFAGPLAQFLLLGLVWLAKINLPKAFIGSDNVELFAKLFIFLEMLRMINLYWPILNLLPIWPLDGGKISRELFEWGMGEKGVRASLGLSMVVAGFLAINELLGLNNHAFIPYFSGGSVYMALFFGLFAFDSFQEMQRAVPPSGGWNQGRSPWEQDPDYWKR